MTMMTEGSKFIELRSLVLHSAVRVPQPQPHILESVSGLPVSAGGNCYACAFQVAAHHFNKIEGTDRTAVHNAIDRFIDTYHKTDRKFIHQNEEGMAKALKSIDLVVVRPEYNPIEVDKRPSNALGIYVSHMYIEELFGKIRNGYLGIVSVSSNMAKDKLLDDDTDHWVVIDGIRDQHTPLYNEGKKVATRITQQIHVVDSNSSAPENGTYWIDIYEFIRHHGGAIMFYVKSYT